MQPTSILLSALALAGTVVLAGAGQERRTFTGIITDSECATAGHAHMQMGANDAECVTACVLAHGAAYVLLDGKEVYRLTDQTAPERFAARAVRVVGTLDAKTIRVESISAAN